MGIPQAGGSPARLAVGSAVGLGMETTLVLPLAAGYLLTAASAGEGSLARGDPAQLALLAAAGPVTVLPLVCFAAATVRLPLSVLGFFQYIAPSAMFLLASPKCKRKIYWFHKASHVLGSC